MQLLGRQHCKVEEDLGKGCAGQSSAHNLDEMSSQYGVSKGDVLRIKSEEKLTKDEAIYRLLEEFELMVGLMRSLIGYYKCLA